MLATRRHSVTTPYTTVIIAKSQPPSLFRTIRIAILLIILVLVAGSTWLTKVRTSSWERPLRVAIFPIAGDDSKHTYAYIDELKAETFAPIAKGRAHPMVHNPVDCSSPRD